MPQNQLKNPYSSLIRLNETNSTWSIGTIVKWKQKHFYKNNYNKSQTPYNDT